MLLNFNLISRFLPPCLYVHIRKDQKESEKKKERKQRVRVSKEVNVNVWKREIRCKLKKNSKSHWSSRLLNRVREHSNVIPSQFHNPSISATLSPAHPLNTLTLYLFSTFKMMWGSRGRHADTERDTRGLRSVHVEQCSLLQVWAHASNFCSSML